MKKRLAMMLALVMLVSSLAACGSPAGTGSNEPSGGSEPGTQSSEPAAQDNGKILFLSNMNAGPQYDAYVAYMDMAFGNLGYDYEIVYGDASNDPAANLTAVENAMTNDVVGLIACQDGGLAEIMAEYPDLYVAGFTTDMASVYGEGGTNAAVKDNDHFLGTVADQYVNGADVGQMYFDLVVEKGYKKVATICFPPFAYPQLAVADEVFRSLVEDYNQTADEPIEVVGEVEVLMFEPLSDAYFMEPSRQDLDCIVAPLAGCTFVYPALKSAIANGTISADTKLLTSGFETDADLIADFGDDGVISGICIVSPESILFPIVMLDNAIQGRQFSDYTTSEAVDSAVYIIDSKEDMDLVVSSSLLGTGDVANTTAPWDAIQDLFVRNNESATYQGLKDFLYSEALTVDGLA